MTLRTLPSFQTSGILIFALALSNALIACGSDEKDGDEESLEISLGDGDIGSGLGDGAELDRDSDGGSVDLSSSQVADFQSASCTGWAAEGENLPATLQLVVDASSSMTSQAPGSQRSKWEVTRDALNDAIDELPPSIAVGMLHYPNIETIDREQCVNSDAMTPIEQLGNDGSDHRRVLRDSLNDATLDNTGTPTFEAYKTALLGGLVPYQGANRFMLLITDGAPTIDRDCAWGEGDGQRGDSPTQPIIDLIETANDSYGIRSFVIGSPGSERSSGGGDDMRPWLSEAAQVGGTDTAGCSNSGPNFCHMDMTEDADFATSLANGLAAVVSQVIDACIFAVPDAPKGETIDPNETNLVITWGNGDSTLLLPDAASDCDEGWHLNKKGEIELCEDSCDEVKGDNRARVQLTFGCQQEEIDAIIK